MMPYGLRALQLSLASLQRKSNMNIIVKGINGIEYSVKASDDNINIKDSWLAKGKEEKMHIINEIKRLTNVKVLEARSMQSMLTEWKAHNVLYKWNIERARTADVDIDINPSLLHRICYKILSIFPE